MVSAVALVLLLTPVGTWVAGALGLNSFSVGLVKLKIVAIDPNGSIPHLWWIDPSLGDRPALFVYLRNYGPATLENCGGNGAENNWTVVVRNGTGVYTAVPLRVNEWVGNGDVDFNPEEVWVLFVDRLVQRRGRGFEVEVYGPSGARAMERYVFGG